MSDTDYLSTAITAARAAGDLLRENFGTDLLVNSDEQFDLKIDLDEKTQQLITDVLLAEYPHHAVLGEEGTAGSEGSDFEWIVDPIDGTVNFFYNIPHFCISIALREAGKLTAGVIYDPMLDELWQVAAGGSPLLNGKPISVSARRELGEAVLTVGFAKSSATIDAGMPLLSKYVYRARKCRMMGSAALALAYVSCGRLDAFIETGINIWDIAAGQLLVEAAGGKVETSESSTAAGKLAVTAWNGIMDLELEGQDA